MLCLQNKLMKVGITVKLIAIDLDGTLLNRRNEISKENVRAIKYAQSKGIEVVIATGRAYFDALTICKRAEILTYVISCNGSAIHSPKGDQISSITMNKEDVYKSTKVLEKDNFYYEVTTNNAIYTLLSIRKVLQNEMDIIKSDNPELDIFALHQAAEIEFSQSAFEFVNDYTEILEKAEKYYKILAFSFDELKRKAGVEMFKEIEHLSLVSSGDYNFEIANKHAYKGNALEKLSSILNISLNHTMAKGDSYNDVSMFKKACYNVAMGNAKDDIKEICDIVTSTNDENGVAHAIHKFINRCKSVS